MSTIAQYKCVSMSHPYIVLMLQVVRPFVIHLQDLLAIPPYMTIWLSLVIMIDDHSFLSPIAPLQHNLFDIDHKSQIQENRDAHLSTTTSGCIYWAYTFIYEKSLFLKQIFGSVN